MKKKIKMMVKKLKKTKKMTKNQNFRKKAESTIKNDTKKLKKKQY